MHVSPNNSLPHGKNPTLSSDYGIRIGVDNEKRIVLVIANERKHLYPIMKFWNEGKEFSAVNLKTKKIQKVSKKDYTAEWRVRPK